MSCKRRATLGRRSSSVSARPPGGGGMERGGHAAAGGWVMQVARWVMVVRAAFGHRRSSLDRAFRVHRLWFLRDESLSLIWFLASL